MPGPSACLRSSCVRRTRTGRSPLAKNRSSRTHPGTASSGRLRSFLAATCIVLGGVAATAQGEIEPFPTVDPYTKNDPDALIRAGYVSFGPFRFGDDHTTQQVEGILGGVPLIWVETTHFKLGSGLPECRIGEDKREKERLKAELERLDERLPDVKLKPKKLDPWLRLHLYALRLEDLYAEFQQRFAVKDSDFPMAPSDPSKPKPASYMGEGPFLGMPSKFTVVIFDRKSHLGRYSSVFFNTTITSSYRWHLPETGSLLFMTAAELLEGDYANDSALGCDVTTGVVQNLANAFRYHAYDVPLFWSEGLAHWFSRRFDPRFHFFTGTDPTKIRTKDEWNWAPSVRNRVEHEVFPPTSAMLAWHDPNALEWADHLIAWSRVDYLMAREDGAAAKLMRLLKEPLPPDPGAGESATERTARAFHEATGQDPEQFDAAWSQWVLAEYPKK